jgi:hypothetical protein
MRYWFSLGLLLAASGVWAQAELPPPPVTHQDEAGVPPVTTEDSVLTPEVNIIQTEAAVVEEYRREGRLYLVKVVPRGAPPYYFFDQDGDGTLETSGWWRAETPAPMWRLFSW